MSTPRSRKSARTEAQRPAELGAGLLGTALGVFLFLLFLVFAVQVAFDLYSRSAVSAAAFDAARLVAASDVGDNTADDVRTRAEARARSVLGRYGDRAEFDWRRSHEQAVVLTVRVPNPSLLPPALRVSRSSATVRTVRVHTERVVGAP